MASKRPSRIPIISTDSFQSSRSKGNEDLIDFFRRASLRSSVVLDHDFASRFPRRNTPPYINYDTDFDSESSGDDEETRVLQGDEKNSDLETIKNRIHKKNVRKKIRPYYYSYMISRKNSQRKQASLKGNVPSYRWLDIKHNDVLTSSATKDVTRPRANTFPSELTTLCSIPIETTATRCASDEIISDGNTSVEMTDQYLMLPSVWKGKTPPTSSKTSMRQPDVLNTKGTTKLPDHVGTRQRNQDERSNKRSSNASLLSVQFSFQGKVFAEDPHPEVNLPDSDKISERNMKKKISKAPFPRLKRKVSHKGKRSVLNHSLPNSKASRSMDLHVVPRSSSKSKQANDTLNKGGIHRSTQKNDLSQTVKEFVEKPQPSSSWPSLRVSKVSSLDLQFPCDPSGKQETHKVHLSKTAPSSGVPVNTDTCPSLSKFTDRKWYYQDKTGRCRYLREPVSPTPPVSSVFMKEVSKPNNDDSS